MATLEELRQKRIAQITAEMNDESPTYLFPDSDAPKEPQPSDVLEPVSALPTQEQEPEPEPVAEKPQPTRWFYDDYKNDFEDPFGYEPYRFIDQIATPGNSLSPSILDTLRKISEILDLDSPDSQPSNFYQPPTPYCIEDHLDDDGVTQPADLGNYDPVTCATTCPDSVKAGMCLNLAALLKIRIDPNTNGRYSIQSHIEDDPDKGKDPLIIKQNRVVIDPNKSIKEIYSLNKPIKLI